MIPTKYKGEDLIGRRCRPLRNIRNGGGDGITPNTVCIITNVVRGHGFTIETVPCPCCGQYAHISRVRRCDLELLQEDNNHA